MKWKKLVAWPLSEAVYHADVVVACGAAVAYGVVAWQVWEMPGVMATLTALVVAAGVFALAQLFPRRLLGRGWMALTAWGVRGTRAPAAARPVPAPVLAAVVVMPTVERPSRSTEPRPLAFYELPDWECPVSECGLVASSGTHHWDDRGPFQLLSVHRLQCPAGHRWMNSSDGG
ncbi:hypothetical protein ACFY2W_36245 [Streptomyces sp. NPDC001262]|uniref:hypothetical protein n=1 Tax=Streptomyces sp. NPDC001262 TaxID=3364552 RepID=UPI0036B7E4C9